MFIVVMGVAGAGKTTVGTLLASTLSWPFYDADDLHPPANVAKMAAGVPLDDSDRGPWLEQLCTLIEAGSSQGKNGVLACSALREFYRDRLRSAGTIVFVYLKADPALILERLQSRRGHYMPPELLESQFRALEEPQRAIDIPAGLPPDQIVSSIRAQLGL